MWMSGWVSQISVQPSKLIPRVGSLFTRLDKNKSTYYKTTEKHHVRAHQRSSLEGLLQDLGEDVTADQPQLHLQGWDGHRAWEKGRFPPVEMIWEDDINIMTSGLN